MKNLQLIILIGVSLFFLSCGTEVLQPGDYISWMETEDNGFIKSKTIENLEYKIQYKPTTYVAVKNAKGDADVFSKEMKELGDLQYFTFQIKALTGQQSPLKYNLRTEEEYYERIKYFSFDIQRDLKIIEGNDTLNCVLSLFERTYNISPTSTFSLAFEKSKSTEVEFDKEFLYRDRVFNAGPIRLQIEEEDIKDIPELKI